jgi:hypothetical protein
MKELFLKAILSGDYQKAKKLSYNINIEDLTQFLIDQSINTGSISIYTFVCLLLIEHESLMLHSCATGILNHEICFFEGATSAALFHARRMVELAPQNIAYKIELLCYFGMPEQVINKEEAKNIAREILVQDPQNTIALQTIKDISLVEKQKHS